jgi:hypothetical protein
MIQKQKLAQEAELRLQTQAEEVVAGGDQELHTGAEQGTEQFTNEEEQNQ